MDLLDMYDQNKNYTGQANRQKAHAEGLWHWLAVVYAYDQQGQLLVQKHKKFQMLDHSVGGHVDAGEAHSTAAHREAKEELGLDTPLVLISDTAVEDSTLFANNASGQNHFHAIYECMVPLDWEFKATDEVDEILPMRLSEVITMMHDDPSAFTPGFLTTMDYYLKAKGIKSDYDIEHSRKYWDIKK